MTRGAVIVSGIAAASRLVAPLLAAVGLTLAFAGTAAAATFTLTPGKVFSSGAGPFPWSFESTSSPWSYEGWVGYKPSTEPTWHRCLGQSAGAELANLPDGTYSIDIADDVNEDYLESTGAFFTSRNTCRDASHAPPGAVSQDTIVIDSTPPAVGAPSVIVYGHTVQVSAPASDAGTGVASYTWIFGDGAQETTTQPFARYTYLLAGTYTGAVIVADSAGNQTQRALTVSIASSAPPNPGQGGGTQPPTLPRASLAGARRHVAQIVAARTGVHPRLRLTCSRINSETIRCTLAWTLGRYHYRASGRVRMLNGRWSYDLRGTRTEATCRADRCTRPFDWHS